MLEYGDDPVDRAGEGWLVRDGSEEGVDAFRGGRQWGSRMREA
jgi:hypothetical protein